MWTLWHTNLQVCCYFFARIPKYKSARKRFLLQVTPQFPSFSRVCRDQKYWWTVVCCCRRQWRQLIRKFTHTYTQSQSGISAWVCAWKVNKINVLCLRAKKVRGVLGEGWHTKNRQHIMHTYQSLILSGECVPEIPWHLGKVQIL